MRLLPAFLLAPCLAAQEAGRLELDLRTNLGADPAAQILLAAPGCWDGLILGTGRPAPPKRRRNAEATVEVLDLALRESPRAEAFGLYLGALRERLLRAWALPPPSHGRIELAEFAFSDPAHPQKLDLTKVKSMQDRFNRLPPSGSPVR